MMTRRAFARNATALGGIALWPLTALADAPDPAGWWYPEEADPHERSFLQWPVSRQTHADPQFLAELQATIARQASQVAETSRGKTGDAIHCATHEQPRIKA